ncbi:DnaB-like helicase C-terminal domain-containing protein, partial [Curtobacterium sp. B18]|uniref:DnaB-like helicase C-terminal domain-containing protein n=1 Tax=Curtobacterium sp. B18 TaxID=95614 RepID=UPI0003B6FDFB
DDRVPGRADEFAPNAKVVHVDIDPAEISKIRFADVPIVGDAREVLVDLLDAWNGVPADERASTADWWTKLDQLRTDFPLGYAEPTDGLLAPQAIIRRIGELSGPEAVYASGVGQHQMCRQQEVSEFSRALKLMAKELQVPVVALSQLNRGPEQRADKKPQISDLRESGSIEQDADMVILLHRESAYEKDNPRQGEADLIVAKHRNGPTDTITVAFHGMFSRFVDMPQ